MGGRKSIVYMCELVIDICKYATYVNHMYDGVALQ